MNEKQPLTLTVEQAAEILGVCRSTAYELVRNGGIESLRLRRRIVIPVAHVARLLGVSAAEIWSVLGDSPPGAAESKPFKPRPPARRAESLSLF